MGPAASCSVNFPDDFQRIVHTSIGQQRIQALGDVIYPLFPDRRFHQLELGGDVGA